MDQSSRKSPFNHFCFLNIYGIIKIWTAYRKLFTNKISTIKTISIIFPKHATIFYPRVSTAFNKRTCYLTKWNINWKSWIPICVRYRNAINRRSKFLEYLDKAEKLNKNQSKRYYLQIFRA